MCYILWFRFEDRGWDVLQFVNLICGIRECFISLYLYSSQKIDRGVLDCRLPGLETVVLLVYIRPQNP